MNRVELSYLGDKLLAKFKPDKKISKIIAANSGYFSPQHEGFLIPRDKTRFICREFRLQEVYMNLAEEIRTEFNVDKHGFSEKEKQKKWEELQKHHSAAVDDPEFNEEALRFREGFKLHPFQRAGISCGVRYNGRILVGDEMGLGKTIQAIGIARYYQTDWPVVVAAPASLLYNWKKEFLNWIPDLKEHEVQVATNSKFQPSGKVLICSYDYAAKRSADLGSYLGLSGVLIVDESHNIKTAEAARTKGIISLAHMSKRCVMISGTPILNRPVEIFTQLHALNPKQWEDYYSFVFRYCDAKKTKFGLDVGGASNLNELHDILINNYMVRRKKKQVLKQLPSKSRYTRYVESNAEYQKTEDVLEAIREEITIALMESNFDIRDAKNKILSEKGGEINDDLFAAYRLTSEAKADKVCDLIMDELENSDEKLIIFGHHEEFLSAVEERLKEHQKKHSKFKYMKIDGTVPVKKRFQYTEDFQADDNYRVALLSIHAASVGLTLTTSNKVFMCELPWTPGLAQQAEDRAHRIGQTKDVSVYYIIMEGTLDSALWNMLSRKSDVASVMLDGGFGDTMAENITVESGDLLTILLMDTKDKIDKNLIDLAPYYQKMRAK